ncbi:UNVERIFIED_CONTAM: Protein TAR1 [Sesamum indicum]
MLTRTLLRRSRSVGVAPLGGDRAGQLPYALRVCSPVDSHTCQTPWSVFQDGSNGEPAGQRRERAVAEARRGRALSAHDRGDGRSAGISTARLWPPPQSALVRAPSRSADRLSAVPHPTGAHRRAPIRFPPDNFKHSLTLFSKSFSSFPRGTCSLSVSRPYLALDGIYRPIGAAFPNNPTRRQRLVVRQGPGTTGLSPSPAPLSRGLGPGPPLRTLLQTTIRTAKPPILKLGCSRDTDAERARQHAELSVQPPLVVTSVAAGSHLGRPRAGAHGRPMSAPHATGGGDAMRDAQADVPWPNGFGRNLRSKTRWFTGFCNSHQVSHFATFFIDRGCESERVAPEAIRPGHVCLGVTHRVAPPPVAWGRTLASRAHPRAVGPNAIPRRRSSRPVVVERSTRVLSCRARRRPLGHHVGPKGASASDRDPRSGGITR